MYRCEYKEMFDRCTVPTSACGQEQPVAVSRKRTFNTLVHAPAYPVAWNRLLCSKRQDDNLVLFEQGDQHAIALGINAEIGRCVE